MKAPIFSRTKLIFILTIILVFAFTFTSIISYDVTKEAISRSAKTETLPLISNNIFSEIQQILLTPINNSSLMANDSFLIDWVLSGENDGDEVVRYLRRIKEEYGYFSSFFISDLTHNYYYYDGILKQISPEDAHDVWYYDFINMGVDYDLDVDTDEATRGTVTIFINHRLEDETGKLLGVTGVGLEMNSIGKTLEQYRQQFDHLIYMIDSEGLIQIHPDPNLILSTYIQDLEGIGELSEEILSQKSGTSIYEYKNSTGVVVLSVRYFPDLDWILIVEQDQTQSLEPARHSLVNNILIGVGVTVLVIVLVILTLNYYYSRLESLAINDELTGLYNRRKFQELFQREISYAKRYEQPLSVLWVDIDRFKSINDEFGHHAGDELLRQIAVTLQRGIRDIDVIGRWGGEEFVILLHKTDAKQAYQTAERLRKAIAELRYDNDKSIFSSTVSIGAASSQASGLAMDEMLKLADEAMYRAKQEGRNRTCLAAES